MTYRNNPPTIRLEDLIWDEIGEEDNPRSRLLSHIRIGDLDMHLEAREIDQTQEFQTTISCPESTERLQAIEEVEFTTTDINGREYIMFALPYGD